MQKSEVMNRNASLSSELCAKSSKETVCNEVFRFTGNSTSSDHKNFRQCRNSAAARKRNKKKICRKTPYLDNKMRKMVIKQMQKSEVLNKNASLSSVLNEKSSEGTVRNEVLIGSSTSTYYKNSRNGGKQFLFRVEKEEDFTCYIRQSQVNFASNPFVSCIIQSPYKQEHRRKLFRMICVGMESIWVSGNDHKVYRI